MQAMLRAIKSFYVDQRVDEISRARFSATFIAHQMRFISSLHAIAKGIDEVDLIMLAKENKHLTLRDLEDTIDVILLLEDRLLLDQSVVEKMIQNTNEVFTSIFAFRQPG
jgi:SpoU rRNA methylase family enzyme